MTQSTSSAKLPGVLYLGYRDIKVKRSGTIPPEEYGHYSATRQEIVIGSGKHGHDEANTVLHEILHACLRMSADPILDKEAEEERLVTVLANQLTEMWRRNPALIAYLNAKLGRAEQ